ncbi:MAG TPA: signal peptidase II, partial [Chroococcales cyanobacterium]
GANQNPNKWIIAASAILCIAIDWLTKMWARQALLPGQNSEFIPGVLSLLLTWNTGAAFSLGRDHSMTMTAVACLVTGVVVLFIVQRHKALCSNLERVGLGCLLGGAVGNLIDRFFYGRVTDFLNFAFISFPVFNVADVCIDVGIGLILIALLKDQKQQTNQISDISGTERS